MPVHSRLADVNRRTYLTAGAAGLASLAGCTAVAKTTRADITADPSLVRGEGDPVTTEQTIDRDSIEYLEETDEIRYGDTTELFGRWARRECAAVGSTAVLPAIEDRFEKLLEGVGKGVRGLLFGLVITVDHTLVRDRDGSVTSEPNVDFEELVAVTPRTVTTTVVLEGRDYTRVVPVIVQQSELQQPRWGSENGS